jgi:hypothetical protein
MTELVRYDAMCRAISDAYKVDEVKSIRDKAMALEFYAKQSKNVEAERQACEIRLRAERRAGELLKDLQKAVGGRPAKTGSSARPVSQASLKGIGISKDQSSKWQRLANVPEEIFDHELKHSPRPTTSGIIKAGTAPKKNPVSPDALWLWGRLNDFEKDILDKSPRDVLKTMTPQMLDDVHHLAPRVANWLKRIGVA